MRFIQDRILRRAVFGAVALIGISSFSYAQDADGRGVPVDDLCSGIVEARAQASAFAVQYAGSSGDIDDDGLSDAASIALVREVACNDNAPLVLSGATQTAYSANLVLFDGEAAAGDLADLREGIALLMLTSATTEASVKAALALANPPIVLAADYAQVTCSGGVCMPEATRATASSGEYLDFDVAPRAANEPFAADGDLDGDGVTNVTEFNNVFDQGGDLDAFVIAATSAELDGTEPVRSGGSSGCFIATAAFGTPLSGRIDVLRSWRDSALLTNIVGASFADAYYRVSPPIASRVASSSRYAQAVRFALVPAIAIVGAGQLTSTVAALFLVGILGVVGRRMRPITSPARRPRRGRDR